MADGRHFEKKPLNRHILATVWPILMKFGTVTQIGPYRRQTVKMLNFSKTKMAAVATLINHKNCDITTTDWPIFAKFGMIMQIGPFKGEAVKISKFWKSKMAERKQQPTSEGKMEVLVYKMKCTWRS